MKTEERYPAFCGRRIGRPFSAAKKDLLEDVLGHVQWDSSVPPPPSFFIEIGFGMGDHLLQRLVDWPEAHFLGIEAFQHGVVHFLSHLPAEHRSRVRIANDNVHKILPLLPDESVDGIFLLFPDPWPKKKHHKRRLLQTPFVHLCHRLLKKGGQFFVGSDDMSLLEWMQEQLTHSFSIKRRISFDPWPWPMTKYARKAQAAGRSCGFMMAEKSDCLS